MSFINKYSEYFGLTKRHHIKVNWIANMEFSSKAWYSPDMLAWPLFACVWQCLDVRVWACIHLHVHKQASRGSPVSLVASVPSDWHLCLQVAICSLFIQTESQLPQGAVNQVNCSREQSAEAPGPSVLWWDGCLSYKALISDCVSVCMHAWNNRSWQSHCAK